jgi:hypothetical protein
MVALLPARRPLLKIGASHRVGIHKFPPHTPILERLPPCTVIKRDQKQVASLPTPQLHASWLLLYAFFV